jgi:hypothetical protein
LFTGFTLAGVGSQLTVVAIGLQVYQRLQGVFIVVVAGGPRPGDFVAGSVATGYGEALAAIAGGIACVLAVAALSVWQRDFLRYDAREPTP